MTRTIPAEWMPPAVMQRIIMHWSAGAYEASEEDRKHYHVIVEGSGRVVRGKPSIALNEEPTFPGYAAHTLNKNSGSIGVSMACMAGAKEQPFDAGKRPMRLEQFEVFIQAVAELAIGYKIPVTSKTILSHAEVQETLGVKQRGKWDFTRLSPFPDKIGARACGDFIRRKVIDAIVLLEKAGTTPAPPKTDPAGKPIPTARVEAPSGLMLREGPGQEFRQLGKMPDGTIVEVHGTQGIWANVRTPFGARGWASRTYLKT